ncbi:hypothetical protein ACSSVY_001811 [Roseovarius sp. MBR-51]
MKAFEQRLWDQWGQEFIRKTTEYEIGHEFEISDVFPEEWNVQIVAGDRNNLGKAVKAAFLDQRYRQRLQHIEPPWLRGDNHNMYRRR